MQNPVERGPNPGDSSLVTPASVAADPYIGISVKQALPPLPPMVATIGGEG